MQLPDEAPKLPKLPFIIGDGLLIAAAVVIAQRSETPLPSNALLAIVACVALGAVLAIIPFLVDYARRQDAALTERQNSLEALGRTTAAAAEQIGIAVSGMHTIGELVHKNLRVAEQLPHKLQEKINEFNQQRDEATVAENEALTQEVNSLRASEAEKLESAATRIHRTAAELAKAEAELQRHLASLRETVDRLPVALDQAGTRAAKAVSDSGDDVVAKLLAEIDAHLAAAAGSFAARASLAGGVTADASPKPSRKAERAPAPAEPRTAPVSEPVTIASSETPAKAEVVAAEPPPSPPAPEPAPEPMAAADEPDAKPAAPRKRPRKERAANAPDLPGFLLDEESRETVVAVEDGSDESASHAGELERSLSVDGITRLVVTAYIGIGNRLFVRGDGPGLSRDKGTPLQFVSIGKWRWETPDATAPVNLRVYKNDQIECPGLGEVVLDPGQQGEVTANF